MAETKSRMLPLGTRAPAFRLPDTDGTIVTSHNLKNAKALLVAFICNHCPYVKHIQKELARLAAEYQKRGVAVVAINSNDTGSHPEDGPEEMKKEKQRLGYPFPYLFDESQEVAKLFQAACTPDFYLFNESRELVYRGQLDDSRPGSSIPVTGKDLRSAIDNLLEGRKISEYQKASVGCNIKWRSGNEPSYLAA